MPYSDNLCAAGTMVIGRHTGKSVTSDTLGSFYVIAVNIQVLTIHFRLLNDIFAGVKMCFFAFFCLYLFAKLNAAFIISHLFKVAKFLSFHCLIFFFTLNQINIICVKIHCHPENEKLMVQNREHKYIIRSNKIKQTRN